MFSLPPLPLLPPPLPPPLLPPRLPPLLPLLPPRLPPLLPLLPPPLPPPSPMKNNENILNVGMFSLFFIVLHSGLCCWHVTKMSCV
jgi:hypothetical protein